MYNSVTVTIIMKIVTSLGQWYQYSMIHHFLRKLSFLGSWYRESKTCRFLTNTRPLFEETVFYKLLRGFFQGLAWICKKLHKIFFRPIRESLFLGAIDEFNSSFNQVMALISLIFLYTGLFTTFLGILTRHGMRWPLVLLVVGILGSLLQGKYETILKNSILLEFFLDFFRLDKGDESWW